MIELPSPPSNVVATTGPVTEAGLATATVTFDASTSTGGSSISQYQATSSPDGLTGVGNMPGAGSITVTGLTAGTACTFTVTATAGSNSGQVVVTWSPRSTSSNIGCCTKGKRARLGVRDSVGVQLEARRRRMQLSAPPPTSLLARNTSLWSKTVPTTPLELENSRTR